MSLKKGQKESKQYYRPVSILPDISKIMKVSNYLENIFSKFQ